MIVGVGIDSVELSRIEKLDKNVFSKRILSSEELNIYNTFTSEKRKIEYLAGRFAGKEAFSKAYGTGIGELKFKDISILNNEDGKPIILYKDLSVHISITHTNIHAMAFVVIEK